MKKLGGVESYIDVLNRCDSVDRSSKIGVVGHCFSGVMAMRMVAAPPDVVGTVAAFHGGGLYTDGPASPHLVLPRINAKLHFAHAVKDGRMPEEAIQSFEKALDERGGKYESETYEGAYHSWTAPDSPVYNPAQAERAFAKLVALFERTLHG